jgi:hypothetical protein
MSLEQAIEANTAAIRDLIAVMTADLVAAKEAAPKGPLPGSIAADLKIVEQPEAKKPTPAPAANPVSSLSGAEPQSDPAPVVQEPIAVDLMKDVVPVFSKLCVDKGRDAGAAILKKWNVTKLSLVPADKLVAVLEDIKAAAESTAPVVKRSEAEAIAEMERRVALNKVAA